MYCVCRWCPWWFIYLPTSCIMAADCSHSLYSAGSSAPAAARRRAAPHAHAGSPCADPLHSAGTPPARQPNALSPSCDAPGRRSDLGEHLRQMPLPQSQRRVAKSFQPQPLQHVRIHLRAAEDISDRRGPIPGIDARCTLLIFVSRSAAAAPPPDLSSPPPPASAFLRRRVLHSPAACRRACLRERRRRPRSRNYQPHPRNPSFCSARRSSQSINFLSLAMSSFSGGSVRRNSCCSRTAPSGRLHHLAMRPWSDRSSRSFRRPGRSAGIALSPPAHASPPPDGSAAPLPVPRSPQHSIPSPTSPTR